MSSINFTAQLFTINSWVILRLPESASAKLPSRGQTMIEGTINGYPLQTPLEPDGKWSHWFRLDQQLLSAIKASAGDTVKLSIQPNKQWPEPDMPKDLRQALSKNSKAHTLWQNITPMARWEWVRWIRSTGNPVTRQKRVTVACSKMQAGERRPCCWNRNLSTEPDVSKNGILLTPTGI